jgi:hypothetical protein
MYFQERDTAGRALRQEDRYTVAAREAQGTRAQVKGLEQQLQGLKRSAFLFHVVVVSPNF